MLALRPLSATLGRHEVDSMQLIRSPAVALVALALVVTSQSVPVRAQPAARIARVVVVGDAVLGPAPPGLVEALRDGLRDHGWVEGRNLVLERRHAEGAEQRREISAELERLKVDVVVVQPTSAFVVRPSGPAPIRNVPIVFVGVSDPIGAGMVASLARPGGNMTGITYLGVELNSKRLQLLKEALPEASRVAVLVPTAHPLRNRMVREVQEAAKSLNITLQLHEIAADDPVTKIDAAFDAMRKAGAQAVLGLQGPHYFRERQRIADLSLRYRLPGIFEVSPYAEAGCLMTYAPSLTAIYRRAANYVDKILTGARPSDIPVEQPTTFELVVNLKTARALGLKLPQQFLARADRIVE